MKINKIKKLLAVLTFTLALPFFGLTQTVKEAVEAYNAGASIIKENPVGAIEHLYRALELSEDLDYDGKETKELAESLIPQAHYQAAMQYYKQKKMTETLDQLEKALETSKKYFDKKTQSSVERIIPQLYNQLGNSEYRANDFEGAIKHYMMAIEIKPDYPDPYLGISLSYENMEDFDNMLSYLKKTIEVANNANDRSKADDAQRKAKGYLLRNGQEAQKNAKHEEAVEWFTKVLDFDKTDGSVYFVLAVSYGELKNWEKVIENSQLALDNANGALDEAGIHYQMGVAYQNLGDTAQACQEFNNALSGSYRAAAEYQIKEVLKCQ